ncbi:MAG: mechanosensitive ion channel [Phycisphaerales bacterium]|nr:MAG: mechanosensitive ion channel [Phycisphaerales bacterium]
MFAPAFMRIGGQAGRVWPCLLMIMAAVLAGPSTRATTPDQAPPKAVTTADPGIPVDELKLMLLPLTKGELEVEAAAWRDLLKAKVAEISRHELDVKQKKQQISQAKQDASEAEKAKREAEKTAEEVEETLSSGAEIEAEAGSEQPPDVSANAQGKTDEEELSAEEAAALKAAAEAEARRKEAEKAAAEAEAEAHKADKEDTLEELTALREQRVSLTDRTNAVIDALESKGGDVKELRLYVNAVSGLTPSVDVTDVGGTWIAIRGWFTSKEGGQRWGRNITLFIITLLVSYVVSRAVGSATGKAMMVARSTSVLLKEFMVKIVRRTVFFVGFVIALSMLEVPIAPFLAVIGAAGLVIGLALQGTLSNFASGIMILLHRPFDVGDVVKAADVAGTVESMSVLSTTIKTFDNQRMIVPNNSIWGGVVTNVTGLPTRRVDMVFGIGYGDDINRTQRVLEDIVNKHPLVLEDPEPTIRLHELGDSSVNFVVRPWVRTEDYWKVYWEITRAVKEQFDAKGISIPFPQRDVHVYHETAPSTLGVDAS